MLVHVSAVESGIACGCICPGCEERLIAKKGNVRQHYFAHESGADCAHGLETALHLAAKEALERRRTIFLPTAYLILDGSRLSSPILPAGYYELASVTLEQRMQSVVPDVIAILANQPLIIEIRVTHAVDEEKLRRLKSLGISAIEIDLSSEARALDLEGIDNRVIDSSNNKTWLHNASAEAERARLLAGARSMPIVSRGSSSHVDDCQLRARTFRGQPYANVDENCRRCRHAL